jgi:hypothetical protein
MNLAQSQSLPKYQFLIARQGIIRSHDLKSTGNPHVSNLVRWFASDILPPEEDFTRGSLDEPGNAIDQGSLAGTIWANDAQYFFLKDIKSYPVTAVTPPKALVTSCTCRIG